MAWTRGGDRICACNLQELMHMLQEQYGVTATPRLDLQRGQLYRSPANGYAVICRYWM